MRALTNALSLTVILMATTACVSNTQVAPVAPAVVTQPAPAAPAIDPAAEDRRGIVPTDGDGPGGGRTVGQVAGTGKRSHRQRLPRIERAAAGDRHGAADRQGRSTVKHQRACVHRGRAGIVVSSA